MTSRKYCRNDTHGIVLVDILLAMSLSVVFIAAITELSMQARDMFVHAAELDADLDQYGSSTPVLGPYGNDRVESVIKAGSLLFSGIKAASSSVSADARGTPLCSVDFAAHSAIGSYGWYLDRANDAIDDTIAISSVKVVPIVLPIDPNTPLTDIQVRDGIAYISADPTKLSDPDIYIVDIHDPNHSAILSSLDTGPGIVALSIAGREIFAAALSTAAELHVIDMNSLHSLALEKKFKLPLPYATATPPLGSSIFYSGGRVFLGTEKWDGDEFNVINVSNPAQPIKVGGYEVGSKVNDVFVQAGNGLAYLATADQRQLQAIDIRDPAHSQISNFFSSSGWQRQEGKTVSMFEGGLNFGRTSGGYNVTSDHEAFAWAAASSTSLQSPTSVDIPGGVYGIVADRRHIYLATRTVDKELQIFDRALMASTSIYLSLPASPQALTCDGSHLYLLAHNSPIIYEISM